MSELEAVIKKLQEIIKLEEKVPLDQLGSYIVGALLIDESGWKLYQANETIARIAELGSDLEISNGGEKWMTRNWQEIKQLTNELSSKGNH